MCGGITSADHAPEVQKTKCIGIAVLIFGIIACIGFLAVVIGGVAGLLMVISSSILLCCFPKQAGGGSCHMLAVAIMAFIGAILNIVSCILAVLDVIRINQEAADCTARGDAFGVCSAVAGWVTGVIYFTIGIQLIDFILQIILGIFCLQAKKAIDAGGNKA